MAETTSDTIGPVFLGLDLSTQQLKGVLIGADKCIIREINIPFDERFPHYKTVNGRHTNEDQVTAPVLMWVEAIDALMSEVSKTGLAGQIRGISGAAQQHGSVYWQEQGVDQLKCLDSKRSLKEQLDEVCAFALLDSPIWEDSSTDVQCQELEEAVDGASNLAKITGSVAYERFTGPQIAKVKQTQPDVWQNIVRISLVSSFIASVLCGSIVPIDAGDASGTNLYDIQKKEWSTTLCGSIDQDLISLLGAEVVMANEKVGLLSPYFVERYGFTECSVVAFTGDNLSAFAGFESLLDSSQPSFAVISLGTSDTVLFSLTEYPYANDMGPLSAMQHLSGHVLQHPTAPDRYIAMLCYKNGSLARDWVREMFVGQNSTWEHFSDLVTNSVLMAPQRYGFYYLLAEILPKAVGVYRFESAEDGDIFTLSGKRFQRVKMFSDGSDARAILESQTLSMRLDLLHKSDVLPTSVALTGGASKNKALQHTIADVLNVPVLAHWKSNEVNDSSDLGDEGKAYTLQQVCTPNNEMHALYLESLESFEFLREQVSRSSQRINYGEQAIIESIKKTTDSDG
ncbi:hypothetical protein BX070DRAFT_238471 [Coemansia spiralis]|nr:hypothetical protein BX070DRAFT_238471 [Coemansia spiralis]